MTSVGLKLLSQTALPATTLTAIYTTPAGLYVVLRSLVVCNRSATSATFRLSLAPLGAADATSQYLFYDLPLVPNDTFTSELLISLDPTDVVRAYASTANLTVSLFGEL